MRRQILKVITFFMVLSSACLSFSAEQKTVVRVCWYSVQNLLDKDSFGNRSGYVYEYLQRIAEYAGITYEYVDIKQSEYKKALLENKADIICGVPDNESVREVCVLAPTPIGQMYSVIAARKDDDRFSFDDYKAMQGMTVAIFNSPYYKKVFGRLEQTYGFAANLSSYQTPEEAVSAIVHGDADLVLLNSFSNTNDFSIVAQYDVHDIFIGAKKGNAALVEKLDRAIQQINTDIPGFTQQLEQQYSSPATHGQLAFSKAEKTFIKNSPPVNVYVRGDTPVLSYTDKDGTIRGFVPDIFKEVSEKSGLQFNYIPVNDNRAAIKKTINDRNAINGYVGANYKWAEANGLRLTNSVTDYPLVFVYKKHLDHSVYTVGYLDSNFLPDVIIKNSDYKMIPYRTRKEAMDAVLTGDMDAYLVNMYSAQSFLSESKYNSLIMANVETIKLGLVFAVPVDADYELSMILNKTIMGITEAEKSTYLQRNITEMYRYSLGKFIKDNIIIILLVILLFMSMAAIIIIQKYGEKKLADANKSKDAFLANMSHDFRTPLTAIKGLAYLGETDHEPKYYRQIITSSDYLLQLVKDVLNIQQYAHGLQLELFPSPIQTDNIKQEVLTVIQERARAKNIKIQTDYDCMYPYIYVDAVRLKQILINILNNAIKYSPEGSTVEWRMTQKAAGKSVEFVIEIQDHGVGMSRDFLQNKLFHAFEREHNMLSSSEGGTGLGLAITKMIIDRMDGTVRVQSEIGKGTTFFVTIPVESLTHEKFDNLSENVVHNVDTFDFTGKRILVCEDNELNTFIIKSILEKRGCLVDTAPNGEIGVELYTASEENYYAAVLMDIRMPGMGGLEAARTIRSLHRTDAVTTPIVALSANAFAEDKEESYKAGMDAHISKPIDVDVLFSTLSKLLMLRTQNR